MKSKQFAIKFAQAVLKRKGKRTKLAKEIDKQIWNVVLAGGCKNRLISMSRELLQKEKKWKKN